MNVIRAADDTIILLRQRGMRSDGDAGFDHLVEMLEKMVLNQFEWSYGKQCRWLGYMQGVAVANGTVTLEEVKEINKRWRYEEHAGA